MLAFLRTLSADELQSSCLFWDFPCLPQVPRTQGEELVFQKLLGLMGNLYGSIWRTTVLQHLQIPQKPDGVTIYNDREFIKRGWCVFEDGATRFAAAYREMKHQWQRERRPKAIDISGGQFRHRDLSPGCLRHDYGQEVLGLQPWRCSIVWLFMLGNVDGT